MIDPNWGMDLWVAVSGMMTRRRYSHMDESGEDDQPIHLPSWLRWGHIATTVTIVLFMWGQADKTNTERTNTQRDVALLFQAVATLQKADLDQKDQWLRDMVAIERRLDSQCYNPNNPNDRSSIRPR